MPGLLRGAVRTAVVAGTATAVSNRVSRRQAERWQRQGTYPYDQPEPAYAEPQPAYEPGYAEPPPAAAPAADPIQQLKDLAALHEQGVLTDEEFAVQKARILSG
jgi:Short C-terminal domain